MKNQIFKNAEFGQIRTCMVDGEVYFVGKDVATALGYVNDSKAIRDHVDEEDKRLGVQFVTPKGNRQEPSSTKADSTHSSSRRSSTRLSASSDGSHRRYFRPSARTDATNWSSTTRSLPNGTAR